MALLFQNVQTESSPKIREQRILVRNAPLQIQNDLQLHQNRPVKKSSLFTFQILILLLFVSVVVVFFIWNKIAVNRLAQEINLLENQHKNILSINEVLRAEINQKSRLERIEKTAIQHLGLTYPKEQPIWFEVNTQINKILEE